MDTIDGFIELFQGNKTALGTEEGGCERIHSEDWELFLEAHLRGADVTLGGPGPTGPVGVYPMAWRMAPPSDYAWRVKWGCIDFDEGEDESWVHAKNVHLALQTFGVCGWIERSRSKGYHVWVFLQEWAEAWLVRRALLAACQIVEAPTKEINPKQERLEAGQLGNYVRLPYPGHLAPHFFLDPIRTERRVAVNTQSGTIMLQRFVAEALAQRTNVAALEKLASYWKPPIKPLRTRTWDQVLDGEALDRLVGKARIIWADGPLEGGDRSDTLYKLAMYLREDGRHTRDEAFDLLVDADARWGKFADRPDRDTRLNELLDKAGF